MMFLSTEPGSQYNWIFTNKLDHNQSHVGTSHREMDTGHFSIGFPWMTHMKQISGGEKSGGSEAPILLRKIQILIIH